MTDRERIYNLVDKVSDLSIKAIDKITELKQENSKLKQRVAELEKPKKKRKFRAMTIGEYCRNINYCNKCEYRNGIYGSLCDYSEFQGVDREREKDKSYKTKDGKYILIEVKE